MSFASDLQSVASRLLSTYGEVISVTRSNPSYNYSSGTVTEASATMYTGVGHPSFYEKEYVDDVEVLSTDIKLIFYSVVTIPVPGDVFTINSVAHTAIAVKQLRAQGSNIIYIVQLRK